MTVNVRGRNIEIADDLVTAYRNCFLWTREVMS